MSKVAVVYWSGTGNTEEMANKVAEGAKAAGAEVEVISADDFDGTLFSCIRKKGFSFHNFTSFIILTEEILDFVGKPQSFQEKRTFNKEKKYFRPSIDSTSLRKGKLIKANYIFFPYLENEKEKLNNEDDLKNILPNYYVRYLKPNKKQLCDRKGIDSNKWWMLTRPRMWQMQACPKLVSTEFGKSGNFSFDKTGEYIVERGCAWFFKNAETVLQNSIAVADVQQTPTISMEISTMHTTSDVHFRKSVLNAQS